MSPRDPRRRRSCCSRRSPRAASAPPPPPPRTSPASPRPRPPRPSQTAAREQLARRLARALSDPAFRLRLRRDLDRSPVREHKLPTSNASGHDRCPPRGRRHRPGHRAPRRPRSPARLWPPPALELYLPVPAHRARWPGDANVLVATALHDHEAPVAFDPSGRRRVLTPRPAGYTGPGARAGRNRLRCPASRRRPLQRRRRRAEGTRPASG